MPNPFNPSTTIRYTLAESAPVELGVYDLRGRLASGSVVGSGVYFVRLESRGESRVRKIVLLK